MRLQFSTANYMDAKITDDRGQLYYTVSTPSVSAKKVTTITKYRGSGSSRVPETMGVIEWHRLKPTVFRFDGKVVSVDDMFETRALQTGRYFVGPDRKKYKWKMETTHCWMKAANSDSELVRYHRKNHGIMKPSHPPYLDISPKVVPMLDYVILTFVYIESLREERLRTLDNINNFNHMNPIMINTGGNV